MGWASLVGRPADYLPSGTVGRWLPAPCNTRAATRKPTMRGRLGPRAGIPKRLRLNCHKRKYSQTSVDCSMRKGAVAQRPHCAKGRDPRTKASWRHLLLRVVAQWSDGWGSSTYVLAILSSTVVTVGAGLHWTDAKHRVPPTSYFL